MTTYIYAQVQNGTVMAISEGPSEMILLEANDTRLLGTAYIGTTQSFAENSSFNGFKSVVTANKTEIAADDVDSVTITIKIKNWKEEEASTFKGDIKININGSRKDLTVIDGQASYVYKTTTVGIKNISTQDAEGFNYITHGSLTLEAFGELEEL
ncbi:hypothetical protein [Paenibacillus radicis (ex Xue et al. 2023)]|uniref:Phage tail protein n=1 Tax=Paenibacillus radicis (ex Xue et al. 2023) TaxID=2972489 RepID=A0ABT1YUH0_9BACL|nr:hypothetical protein [Paenibacillus radicis (ex Xue et al. 2023)]MCR8636194.1 hypothetical protein [Paenibacillus radicis (ex Xue et al. 2023)]